VHSAAQPVWHRHIAKNAPAGAAPDGRSTFGLPRPDNNPNHRPRLDQSNFSNEAAAEQLKMRGKALFFAIFAIFCGYKFYGNALKSE
jgi:hypothetical protein